MHPSGFVGIIADRRRLDKQGAMSPDYERALMWYLQKVLDYVSLNSA